MSTGASTAPTTIAATVRRVVEPHHAAERVRRDDAREGRLGDDLAGDQSDAADAP